MSLTNDPAGHLNEPPTPQETTPAAPAGAAAADTDVVASSSALASAVEHSRAGVSGVNGPQTGRNTPMAGIRGAATKFAGRLRSEVPRRVRELRARSGRRS